MRNSRTKFHNIKVTRNYDKKVYSFDSKAEAKRADELYLLNKAKEIQGLIFQPSFELQEKFKRNGKVIRAIKYIADFMYIQNGLTIVEDVKGVKTKEYQMKKKMFLNKFGNKYVFREVFIKRGFTEIVEV